MEAWGHEGGGSMRAGVSGNLCEFIQKQLRIFLFQKKDTML